MAYLERGKVRLAYEEAGSGGPTLLMLHGNSCSSRFFHPQLEFFQDACRVLALDFRGHGQSDAPQEDYTFAGLADDCLWICRELGLGQVVIVAHSMGGAVAAEMVQAQPGLVKAVAALDCTFLPDPAHLRQVLPPLIKSLQGPESMDGLRAFVEPLFAPQDSPQLREWVWRRMSRTPPWVTLSLLKEFLGWRDQSTSYITQPFLYVASFKWRTDRHELRRACPQVKITQIKESGHFLTLSAADQINSLLAEFLGSI